MPMMQRGRRLRTAMRQMEAFPWSAREQRRQRQCQLLFVICWVTGWSRDSRSWKPASTPSVYALTCGFFSNRLLTILPLKKSLVLWLLDPE
jgi:hypothetical protein